MKLHQLEVWNFASYKFFAMDLSNRGLSLIYGATGSGKSTLQDMPCWVLYGVTAKDGNVDDVRSWNTTDQPTTGTLDVELPSGNITVTRIRGKHSENDLYWTDEATGDYKHRGKDITETQALLNKRLGVDADLYLSASYFSEFCSTATFFVAKSKNQREVFEKIANLDLPVRVAESVAESKKTTKATLADKQSSLDKCTGQVAQIKRSLPSLESRAADWDKKRKNLIEDLEWECSNFEQNKANKLSELESKVSSLSALIQPSVQLDQQIRSLKEKMSTLGVEHCPTCNAPTNSVKRFEWQAKASQLIEEKNRNEIHKKELENYQYKIAELREAFNFYKAQIETEKNAVNPFIDHIKQTHLELTAHQEELELLNHEVTALEERYTALNTLYDLSFDLRGALLRKSVTEVEIKTNHLLERYFDSEIKVNFDIFEGDKLTVSIEKSGYACVYRQLSKGQRGLLKLCFVVSVMQAAANRAGTHFNALFLDEALDGLDTDLKVKAYALLEELATEHETVLVIDHAPEFQALFENKYKVELVGDSSEVENE